ncbi:MAG: toll/interleukin-1 receptor domain-containing protein [Myxococcales bacterium]
MSHASADRVLASRIATMLRRQGLSVWYSGLSIRGSAKWVQEIGAGLRTCNWMIVLATRWRRRGKPQRGHRALKDRLAGRRSGLRKRAGL